MTLNLLLVDLRIAPRTHRLSLRVWIVAAGCVLLCGFVSLRADERRFQLQTADAPAGAEVTLIALEADFAEVRSGGEVVRIPRKDLMGLRRLSSTSESPSRFQAPTGVVEVWLTNGDWIFATAVELHSEQLMLHRAGKSDHPDSAPVTIPVEMIRGIAPVCVDREQSLQAARIILDGEATADTLWLVNGDRLAGELVDWSSDECRLSTAGVEHSVPVEEIRAVVLDPELATTPGVSGEWCSVLLTDGSRLTATEVTGSPAGWRVTTTSGFACELSPAEIEQIEFFGDRVSSLSALTPLALSGDGYLAQPIPLRVDRNFDGAVLQIGTEKFGRGLGTWSGHASTWAVPSGSLEFIAVAGVDAAAGSGGSVEFVVRVDGKERFRSGRRTGANPPLILGPLSVAGAQQIELRVEFNDGADLRDYADWCRPVLIK